MENLSLAAENLGFLTVKTTFVCGKPCGNLWKTATKHTAINYLNPYGVTAALQNGEKMDSFTDIEKCCSFTGHRILPSSLYGSIEAAVRSEIKRLYALGVRRFITGGALGFDMLCANAVLSLKKELNGITLTLALPCMGHDAKWSLSEKREFSEILNKADKTVYVSEEYSRYCMFKRNRFMVDSSLYCVSYCTKKMGGSYYTVNYAISRQRNITEISELI